MCPTVPSAAERGRKVTPFPRENVYLCPRRTNKTRIPMITFPNAKINLGLHITSRRPDGYHNLETVFYPVPLDEALEAIPAERGRTEKCRLVVQGNPLPGSNDPQDNLVAQAYRLLDAEYDLPPIDAYLLKRIPSEAGLGGGSADAAFMLRLLNDLFALGLTDERLEILASRLGADCAFFVRNRPTYAEGIGNVFSPVTLPPLAGYGVCIVKPDERVSTRAAFARVVPRQPQEPLRNVVALPVEQWRDRLTNDFEQSVFPQFPAIAQVKDELYARGALYASMSGSGSAVYGLFAPEAVMPEEDFGPGTQVFIGVLR